MNGGVVLIAMLTGIAGGGYVGAMDRPPETKEDWFMVILLIGSLAALIYECPAWAFLK